jgi:hypothetical protein
LNRANAAFVGRALMRLRRNHPSVLMHSSNR